MSFLALKKTSRTYIKRKQTARDSTEVPGRWCRQNIQPESVQVKKIPYSKHLPFRRNRSPTFAAMQELNCMNAPQMMQPFQNAQPYHATEVQVKHPVQLLSLLTISIKERFQTSCVLNSCGFQDLFWVSSEPKNWLRTVCLKLRKKNKKKHSLVLISRGYISSHEMT